MRAATHHGLRIGNAEPSWCALTAVEPSRHASTRAIYAISQLMDARNRGEEPKRTVRIVARDLLEVANRHTGGKNYERLLDGLRRLAGTRIETNIAPAGSASTRVTPRTSTSPTPMRSSSERAGRWHERRELAWEQEAAQRRLEARRRWEAQRLQRTLARALTPRCPQRDFAV